MNERLDKLFDIYCTDSVRLKALETEFKIPMGPDEHAFLQSMRTDRTATCGNVDGTFHKNLLLKEERKAKLERNQRGDFSAVTEPSLEDALEDDSVDEYKSGEADDEFKIAVDTPTTATATTATATTTKRRAKFSHIDSSSTSTISTRSKQSIDSASSVDKCDHIKHVRSSMNSVYDVIYEIFGELDGHNFSYYESQIAIKVIVKRLLGYDWKIPVEKYRKSKYEQPDDLESETNIIDEDTLPTRSAIRKKLKQIHAMSLSLIADRMVEAKVEGAVIAHATDTTTRKHVGSFAPAGIHINKDEYLPLPVLNMSSETTANIAEAIQTDFKLLAAASGKNANELYANVDVHMSDSTAHNKGVASATAELMERDDPAGQLFCNPHTALGFDRGMEAVINQVEKTMGMDQLTKAFLLSVDIDQKRETISLTFVSWILSSFGQDNIQKTWNVHRDFKTQLQRNSRPMHLFLLKDARFGMLSRSCAIVCYHWKDFVEFFDENDYVTNKLACLCHDALELSYIRIVIAAIAAFGIHLISPFFAKTKGTKINHSELQQFFRNLHESLLSDDVDSSFFQFDKPVFNGISQFLFKSIRDGNDYGKDVVAAVTDVSMEHVTECVKLANILRVKLAAILAQQRGQYYDFGGQTPEYYVFDQAIDVDATITNNLEEERQCGDADNRLKKKTSLPTISRGMILKRTVNLREGNSDPSMFRKMGPVVKSIEEIHAEWSQKQEVLREAGLTKKQAQKLHVDQRKLNILDRLKKIGGPFTSAEDIDEYLARDDIDPRTAQKRMRDEIMYTRDTSSSLPRSHKLFTIMQLDPLTKRRRVKTAEEFAVNLRIVLGKASNCTAVSIDDFCNALLNQY